jgi:hypothetical protein
MDDLGRTSGFGTATDDAGWIYLDQGRCIKSSTAVSAQASIM